jgi:uncharacterized membrane protein YdjX (TVP38/TMEM64 family)
MIKSHKKIHERLKKHHPRAVKKARKIFAFKYPKLFLLIICMALTYYLFSTELISGWVNTFNYLGNFGFFISGIFTAFGFTAPLGIGLLTKINPSNIFLATLFAAIGATLADLFIFHTIKFSFANELKELEKTKTIKEIEKIVKKNKHVKLTHYLLYILAGLVIATPVPDEIGVSMLAGLTTIKPLKFAIISFFVHNITIFLILRFI